MIKSVRREVVPELVVRLRLGSVSLVEWFEFVHASKSSEFDEGIGLGSVEITTENGTWKIRAEFQDDDLIAYELDYKSNVSWIFSRSEYVSSRKAKTLKREPAG